MRGALLAIRARRAGEGRAGPKETDGARASDESGGTRKGGRGRARADVGRQGARAERDAGGAEGAERAGGRRGRRLAAASARTGPCRIAGLGVRPASMCGARAAADGRPCRRFRPFGLSALQACPRPRPHGVGGAATGAGAAEWAAC